MVILGRSKVKF